MSRLIAVTGNTGKTVFSYFLARKLCQKEHPTILVATDGVFPTLQMLLPPLPAKSKARSLGKALSAAVIRSETVLQNMITLDGASDFGVLSYCTGETASSYADIPAADIEALFSCLLKLAETVIVDTQTIPNSLDDYAIGRCDQEIQVTGADMKGQAYRFKNQHGLTHGTQNVTHGLPCVTQVLLQTSLANPLEDIKRTFDKPVKYILPHCKTLEAIYNGELLSDTKSPRSYDKVLNKLIQEVLTDGSK